MRKSTPEHFWSMIDKKGPTDCWEWQGHLTPKGYGQISYQMKSYFTHRLAYILTNGPIPEGLYICHICNNRTCCNPAHLYSGTQADNMRDMANASRHADSKGEKNPKNKLTPQQVNEIRDLYARGVYNQYQLAELYKCARPHIGRIINGQSWSHL